MQIHLYSGRKQFNGCLGGIGQGGGERESLKRDTRDDVILSVVIASQMYTYIKSYQFIYFKFVHFGISIIKLFL